MLLASLGVIGTLLAVRRTRPAQGEREKCVQNLSCECRLCAGFNRPTIMGLMFFRRQHPKIPTFAERLENLRRAGIAIAPMAGGVVRARRGGCAVDLKDENGTAAICRTRRNRARERNRCAGG